MTRKKKDRRAGKVAVQYLELEALHPHPQNARVHPEASVAAVKASIERFGFVNPIIAEPDGTIVAGEGRWTAAKELGLKTVPVVVLKMSSDESKAYMAVDNATTELSLWDIDLLREVAEDLKAVDSDFILADISPDAFGFLDDWDPEALAEVPGSGAQFHPDRDPKKDQLSRIIVTCEPSREDECLGKIRELFKGEKDVTVQA